ncbi:MAG: transaldolase [Actinobacteria bacterium]|nr:transaldolase [Actinomycetota bacterium]
MNPLQQLNDMGQAVWLDSIKRSYLGDGGYIARLIEAGELRGLTSNPSIFDSALGDDDAYDEQLRQLQGSDPRDALWAIMKRDVTGACDEFLDLWHETDGRHGQVSIELDPLSAYDTETSVAEGLSLFSEIDRPNLMVKVPGTEPGLPAITRLLAEGVNVNVTLLFSVARYDAVISAFMDGVRARLDSGNDVTRLASVASFFVSRVDGKVDDLFDDGLQPAAPLTAGVANARLAYGQFTDRFAADGEFADLATEGARVQRPLWASTSTKNDAYSDVIYVEQLAVADTVNTMPEDTIEATRDHADIADRVSNRAAEAREHLDRLRREGMDLDQITKELEAEGVEKFEAAFQSAVDTVAEHVT